ncbi:TPA: hypothetical protein DEG21_05340 [Patescibacteria group bacterium]|nr:hypothetical protein [Candidatus Gracilibacteria bacterium]HBY75253.1 hypothetical protein [Candidatus Gracilibacteria bacterium]
MSKIDITKTKIEVIITQIVSFILPNVSNMFLNLFSIQLIHFISLSLSSNSSICLSHCAVIFTSIK